MKITMTVTSVSQHPVMRGSAKVELFADVEFGLSGTFEIEVPLTVAARSYHVGREVVVEITPKR